MIILISKFVISSETQNAKLADNLFNLFENKTFPEIAFCHEEPPPPQLMQNERNY